MKNKNALIAVFTILMSFLGNGVMRADTTGTKIVGGDLSLVPAYVAAGDSWLKADGSSIKTTAQMLAYVKGLGWNSVRVRLFVDPSQDSDPAVCQDIDYVKKLGKLIKDAGLYFLVDFHYSDTWADPDSQKIPARWTTTTDKALADSVYAFTKECLQVLVAYGAAPDYVQVGNEINGGMLWTTSDGEAPSSSSDYATYGYCPYWTDRATYSSSWNRLSCFLSRGTSAVREICPNAKIIIHNAIEGNSTYGEYAHSNLVNFYTYISQNATYPVSYDIIGLSYYPAWHGPLDYLGTALTNLQESFPTKEIQIVETGWYNSSYSSSYTLTWEGSAEGQYNYLSDLKTKLIDYSHVTGVYYWQPEECGNGYGSTDDTKTVKNTWDNRGMWVNETGYPQTHSLCSFESSGTTYYSIDKIASFAGTYNEDFETTFTNLGFEVDATATKTPTGWTINQPDLLSSNGVIATENWMKQAVKTNSYVLAVWSDAATPGHIISQCINVPNGEYTVSVKAYAEGTGYYVCANNDSTTIKSSTAGTYSVTTTVTDGRLNIGLSTSNTGTSAYAYFDAFSYSLNSIDGIVYTFDATTGTASVTGTTSDLTEDVYIPSTINYNGTTYNVTSIADEAFKGNTTINSIHTGNSLTSVGASAFSGCTNLLYACLGTGVTSIGDNAFASCSNLNVLALNSSSAITYGTSPFNDASTTTSVFLSSAENANVSTYTETRDNNGYGFSSGNICETDIKDGVIYGLWPTHKAFVVGYTEDLTANILIPSTLHYDEYVPCTQYFMDMIEQYAFAKAPGLATVTVCNNTNQIGACAFRNCTSLTSVTFGKDATTFHDYIFYGDSKLKSVTIYNSNAPGTWGTNSLSGVTLNCPYESASTEYSGFGTYNTTLSVKEVALSDQSETDVTKSSLTADAAPTYGVQNVTISRALTAENYYTIVLPWDLSATEVTNLGITPYYLNDKGCYVENNYMNLTFKQAETMQGGVPYLVKCTANQTTLDLGLRFTSDYKNLVTASRSGSDGSVTLTGLYNKSTIPLGDFFVSGKKLYYTTDNKVAIGAFRAYIHVVTYNSGAKPTQIGFAVEDFDNEGIPTRIETLDAETLLPVDSKVYDITGRLLKTLPAQSGVYIVNGKKFMVK